MLYLQVVKSISPGLTTWFTPIRGPKEYGAKPSENDQEDSQVKRTKDNPGVLESTNGSVNRIE